MLKEVAVRGGGLVTQDHVNDVSDVVIDLGAGPANPDDAFKAGPSTPIKLINGAKYLGEWKDGKKHSTSGKGKIVFASGTYYEGTWVDGNAEGKGTLHTVLGANKWVKWQGGMKANMKHG